MAKPVEVWIQRRGVEIIWMHVSAKGVGLPDGQSRAGNRLALVIEDTSGHLDDLALGVPVDSFHDRQVTLGGGSQPQWEKGSENLMRRSHLNSPP